MKLKWEALLAMIALFVLGLWLVWGPFKREGLPPLRDGATAVDLNMAGTRGVLEIGAEHETFRFLFRDGGSTEVLSRAEIARIVPATVLDRAVDRKGNSFFRLLNITSWGSMAWVAIGLAGQIAFFGRMMVQWLVSEGQRQSVVPESFWWMSLVGGVMLFTYFAWRQDIIGVMGQTTGVVVYARNLRLIRKRRLQDARRAARIAAKADPAPEPVTSTDAESEEDRGA